jgi:hypothetical protein
MIASHENSGIERVCAMHVWEEGRTDHQSYFLNFRKVTFQVSINAPEVRTTQSFDFDYQNNHQDQTQSRICIITQ